jgi:type IV secretion system protein VirD4
MYKLSRLMLIGTVLATFACVVVLAEKLGGAILFWIGIALLIGFARRGRGVFTAFGTARWADGSDLRATGMLGARRGLIIGRVTDAGKRSLSKAVGGLFDPSLPSKEACEEFLAAIQRGRKPTINPALVRLPNAVHTAVFAPTGVGKGVSCVVPFLLRAPN